MRQGALLAALVLVLGLVTASSASAASTFLVTNTANSGGGSLRQAILDANAHAGLDRIAFKIPGGGVQTITPAAALPHITDPVVVDGRTQPGYSGAPLINLSGQGLVISAGSSRVLALSISGATTGIDLKTNDGNLVAGCSLSGNSQGIEIEAGSDGNQIGGSAAASANSITGNTDGLVTSGATTGNHILGNTITGNVDASVVLEPGANGNFVLQNVLSSSSYGIDIYANGNTVRGNFIGTNAAGSAAAANTADGISVDHGASSNVIRNNLISGNGRHGIDFGGVFGDGGSANVVQGNRIGTNAAGTAVLPNAQEGIHVADGTDHAKIGGKVVNPPAANLISGNGGAGIGLSGTGITGTVIQSNLIGTNASGSAALANGGGIALLDADGTLIADNVISGNSGAGITISNSADSNHVQGNLIGTDASGTSALGNGGDGISQFSGANSVFGPANVISANGGDGILLAGDANNVLRGGNHVGTDASGTTILANGGDAVEVGSPGQPVGGVGADDGNVIAGGDVVVANAGVQAIPILRNAIFGGGTIVLLGGGNHNQVAPTLTFLTLDNGSTTIRGAENDPSAPSTDFRIEFFLSGACTGPHSPAEQFLLGRVLTTDSGGARSFAYSVPELPAGTAVRATATNLATNETSTFSNCVTWPPP